MHTDDDFGLALEWDGISPPILRTSVSEVPEVPQFMERLEIMVPACVVCCVASSHQIRMGGVTILTQVGPFFIGRCYCPEDGAVVEVEFCESAAVTEDPV